MHKIMYFCIALISFFYLGCDRIGMTQPAKSANTKIEHDHASHAGCNHSLEHNTNEKHTPIDDQDSDNIYLVEDNAVDDLLSGSASPHSDDTCETHENHDTCETHENHEEHSHSNISLKPLEERIRQKCEHNILQIECDDCRGELGIVQLSPQLEKKFLKTEKVVSKKHSFSIELIGELKVNSLKTSIITPILSGRVMKVEKKLGDTVVTGELLAVLQSQEYGKAKSDYITACQRFALAQKNYDWFDTTHVNLKKLLETLQKGDKNLDISRLITGIKIGKYKQELIEVAANYRMMFAKYERDSQIIKNMRRLYQIVQDIQKISSAEQEMKNLAIGEWKGKLLGAIYLLDVSQKNYEREKNLTKTNISTPKELQEAEGNYRKNLAEYQGLVEEFLLYVDQRERELQMEWDSSLARYLTKLEEAEMDLDLHRLEVEQEYLEAVTQKNVTEKMLYILGLNTNDVKQLGNYSIDSKYPLGTLEIRSPITGTILACNISEGQFVEASKEVYTISNLQDLWVWADVYEHHLGYLQNFRKNMGDLKATLILPESYLQNNIIFTLDYLAEEVQENTRTVKMKGILDNRQLALKPGLFIKVSVQIPEQSSSIFIPEKAIFRDEGDTFLFERWKNYWVRKDVVLGELRQNHQKIISGLDEGSEIVVAGGFILKSEVLKAKMGAG